MKKIIFLLFVQLVFSQIEKSIGDFQELKVLDGINLVLEEGEENMLKITGDNTENVVIINKSGSLTIRMQLVKKLKGQNTVVKLIYNSRIFLIEAKEGSTIISKNQITTGSALDGAFSLLLLASLGFALWTEFKRRRSA